MKRCVYYFYTLAARKTSSGLYQLLVFVGIISLVAGNTACTSINLVFDKTPPDITIVSPADGATINETEITILGNVVDGQSEVASVTCNQVPAVLDNDAFYCNLSMEEGSNIIEVSAVDLAGNEAIASITVHLDRGVLLKGNPDSPAINAFFDLPPKAAPSEEIVGDVILSRLDVWFSHDATVGEVNDALLSIGGRIVSMPEEIAVATVAVPLQPSVISLQALAAKLEEHPAVMFAFEARTLVPTGLPPGIDPSDPSELLELEFLLPTRFPAAWNVRAKAQQNCSSKKVNVLVADIFDASGGLTTTLTDFNAQVPVDFTLLYPGVAKADQDPIHGYKVIGALTSRFDSTAPAGANPLPECIKVTGVNMANLSDTQVVLRGKQAVERIASQFPNGRFVMNFSMGYTDEVECGGAAVCPREEYTMHLTHPIYRGENALLWKRLTRTRWDDFLVVTSAGNQADKPATAFYKGLGVAAYDNFINIAATPDPLFDFVLDQTLWAPPMDSTLPSLVASPKRASILTSDVIKAGLQSTVAKNVLMVGATTRGTDMSILSESEFSDRNPDVKAVGEFVVLFGPAVDKGTSFSAPQVTGLAAYLMMLDPSMSPAQVRQAIVANTKANDHTTGIIDAYDTVLSLDAAALPTKENSPVRNALLDVNNDGKFGLADLTQFLSKYIDPISGDLILEPEDRDWSRFDLNGDGYTRGSRLERFDLDRVGSTQFGQNRYSVITQNIDGVYVFFDENVLSDLEILCYYAYSNLFSGTEVDREQRTELLSEFCLKVDMEVTFSENIKPGVDSPLTVKVLSPEKSDSDGSPLGQPGIHVDLVVTGGEVDDLAGVTDADGIFKTRVRPAEGSLRLIVEITARNEPEGRVLAEEIVDLPTTSSSDCDNPEVGDLCGGGIVVYVDYRDNGGQHGLIAALNDQSDGIAWYNGEYIPTGATDHGSRGSGIGVGAANTILIIAAQGSGNYAAKIASDYKGGGYNDWYLPSARELGYLWHANLPGLGEFKSYWTSTEYDAIRACVESIVGDLCAFTDKENSRRVRAVRVF